MAETKTQKKTTAKRGRPKLAAKKRKVKAKETTLEEIETSVEEIAITDFAETTKAELKKLGDKIHEATEKGVHVVKDIADHVQRFANDATQLTKLKIEIHNLKGERTKLYTLMGEQVRNLYISKKLTKIKTRFKDDFKKLDELEKDISEKEKLASGIAISEDIEKL